VSFQGGWDDLLKINVLDDDELRAAINKFISSMLPHEGYDAGHYSRNLGLVFRYVHLEEFTMEYRMLMGALSDLEKLKVTFSDFQPRLTDSIFSSLAEASVMDAVMRPDIGIREWMGENGMDNNLKNDVVREQACQVLWQRCVELYEECFNLGIPSNEAYNYEPELREAFQTCICQQVINTQVAIMRGSVQIGRGYFRGFDGWKQYLENSSAEISERLNNVNGENTIILDSMEASGRLLESHKNYYEKIAEWGIPEIDDRTPISRHRLVVVVGKEGIGKTKYAINAAVNVLLAGKKVVYMCGETEQAVVYVDIIINYVYKKYGYFLRPEHVNSPDDNPEEIRKVVNMAIDTLVSKGLLVLQESFSYETCYAEMQTLYQTTKFDVLFIDHSCALRGSVGDGSLKAKVDRLAEDVKEFRKHTPVCIVVNSHPSTSAKERERGDREIIESPTKGSQDLSVNADEVYVLRENETLKKQGLLKLENPKRRCAARFTESVILQKKFEVSAFIYDENRQAVDDALQLDKQQALDALGADCDGADYSL